MAAVVVFLAPAPVTPFLMVPIVVFLVAAGGLPAPVFLTTVPVLASLVSLVPLALRPARVAGLDGGAALGAVVGAALRPLVPAVVLFEPELASEVAVSFRT